MRHTFRNECTEANFGARIRYSDNVPRVRPAVATQHRIWPISRESVLRSRKHHHRRGVVWTTYPTRQRRPRQLAKSTESRTTTEFSRIDIPADALLAGHNNTTSPNVTDTENSLFTNMAETMPRAFTALRFERGAGILPEPPIPIDLTSGHLHYYRYQVGGLWTTWKPDQTLARWVHIPRRLRGDDGTPGVVRSAPSERQRARSRLKRRCSRAGYQLWGAHHRARHKTPLA